MKQKSIIEQALLQVQNLEEAVTKNAKGILATTMRRELNDLIKESMEDEEDELSNTETEKDMSEQSIDDDDSENLDDMGTDPSDDVEMDDEADDESGEFEDESIDDEGLGDFEDDEEAVDMTDATDDEVLKVFKAMKPTDGVIVKKNNGNVEFNDGNDEYIIKLDSEETSTDVPAITGDIDNETDSMDSTDDVEDEIDSMDDVEDDSTDDEMFENDGSEEEADETIYEIELDEADDETDETKETDVDEAARTFANDVRKPADSGKKYKAGRTTAINEEITKLKKQNNDYKKALLLFKDKINEVAVFNAGLAYSTRLFTEHSTTKQEKIQILNRFDSIKTINESKNLYDLIKTELDNKKTITETVVNKITKSPTTSSKDMLSEAKVYENPEFKRIKDLMNKMNK